MKKIAIKLPEKDRKVKETEEERKERIRMWRTTTTRVIPDKRYKSRAQQRQEDNREW